MAVIDRYLNQVLEKNGSDLHFLAGDPARVRQYGELKPLSAEPPSQPGALMTARAFRIQGRH